MSDSLDFNPVQAIQNEDAWVSVIQKMDDDHMAVILFITLSVIYMKVLVVLFEALVAHQLDSIC